MQIIPSIIQIVFFHENTQFYAERIHRKFDIRKCNPFVALRLIFATSSFVTLMAIVYGINFLAISDSTTFYLYTETRYNWGSYQNGMIGAVSGVSSIIWQALGVGILLRFFARTSVLTVTMFVAVGVHFLQGFTPVGWLFMVGVVVSGFVAIGFPLMQSLFSEQIPKEQQGLAFGGLSSISSIASLVGELITENTLSYCLTKDFITCPGTAFYICAFLFFVDAIICLVIYFKYPQSKAEDKRQAGYVSINAQEEGPNKMYID